MLRSDRTDRFGTLIINVQPVLIYLRHILLLSQSELYFATQPCVTVCQGRSYLSLTVPSTASPCRLNLEGTALVDIHTCRFFLNASFCATEWSENSLVHEHHIANVLRVHRTGSPVTQHSVGNGSWLPL
jgi:hypothetical protein